MRNLLGRLLDRSPQELERIADYWSVDLAGRDRFADVAALYRVMTDVWAVRDIQQALPPDGRALTRELLAAAGRPSEPAELTLLAGVDAEAGLDELRRLYAAGIASVESDETVEATTRLFMPRELALVFERVLTEGEQAGLRDEPLDALLALATNVELEEAAGAWGARVTPGIHARAELEKLVRDHLTRPERVERLVSSLSAPARELWLALRGADGALPLDAGLPPERFAPARRRAVIAELARPLLIWFAVQPAAAGVDRLLFVPADVLHPVTAEPAPPPDLLVIDVAGVVEADWLFPEAAAWDLLTIVREVQQHAVRWNDLNEPDPTLVRRMRTRLWHADRESGELPTGYLPFIVRVGALLGILQDDDNRAQAGPAAREWRERAFAPAQQRMVAAWAAAETWIEGINRLELVLYGAAWPAFRGALLRALGQLEPDIWYEQAGFVERLMQTEPDLLRQAQVGALASSQLAMQIDTRRPVESRRAQLLSLVIGATLETACSWLNLIERSRELATGRPVFRLTPFGRWIAGRGPEPASQRLGQFPFAVGANFEVLLFRPTPRRVWALSAFAELKALDRVSTYNLTAPALIRALAGGVDLSDIIDILERQNGGPLPQNVAYTLAEWDSGYRRVWLRRAVLLEPEDGGDQSRILEALRDAGLDPELLPDGRIALAYDAPDAGERIFSASSRALRERGFAPLGEPDRSRAPTRRRG